VDISLNVRGCGRIRRNQAAILDLLQTKGFFHVTFPKPCFLVKANHITSVGNLILGKYKMRKFGVAQMQLWTFQIIRWSIIKKNYLTASSIVNEKSLLVYWVTIKQNLLYKHQCFIKISATEKIKYFHMQKYDIFTCKNISQSEIRKSSLNLNHLSCLLYFEQDTGHF